MYNKNVNTASNAASDTLKSSDAYVEMIGGHFAGHPWTAGGEHGFVNHDPKHRIVQMFPERFRWKDEIYQYDPRYQPENVHVLLSIDMAASKPKHPWHVPVTWIREYGRGRVFYTNLGHNNETWGRCCIPEAHYRRKQLGHLKSLMPQVHQIHRFRQQKYLRSAVCCGW